jgi:hypothetical protein
MPEDKKQTDKAALGVLAKNAFNRFGLSDNYPELRIVQPSHDMIEGKRIARAVQFESGPDSVYISSRALRSPQQDVDEYLQHEASHLAAWRKHGPQIEEHGREWRRICLALASHPRVCKPQR